MSGIFRPHAASAVWLSAFLLGFCPTPSYAHGDAWWIAADPTTRWCCNTVDCRRLDANEVGRGPKGWLINGQPVEAVYPTKPEGGGGFWGCFHPPQYTRPRCLFIPAMF